MAVRTLAEMAANRPGSLVVPPRTAQITKIDKQGTWCTPLGGDTRFPVGPCRGAHHRPARPLGDGHIHPLERLPVGTVVLLVVTADGPWITAHEEANT